MTNLLSTIEVPRFFSFLFVSLLILGTLVIQGCSAPVAVDYGVAILASHPREPKEQVVPTENVTEFNQDGLGRYLRDGEEVLFISSNGKKIAVTNERVLLIHWHRDLDNIFKSIEHVDIRKIDWLMGSQENLRGIHIYTYDRTSPVLFNYSADKEQITHAIQTQLDNINMIRKELGISVPATVTTTELIKLNEPVIAELRARRQIK